MADTAPTNGADTVTRMSQMTKKTSSKSSGEHPYFKQIKARATATEANRTVIMTVGLGAAVILVSRVSGTPGVKGLNDPGDLLKVAVGTGATMIILMIIAEEAPDLAIKLGWLIAVGAMLTYGADFAVALKHGTLNPKVPPKKGK